MLMQVGESAEFYMVLVTVVILLVAMYFLQKWWTTYR
jgi:hypothetical protein